MLRILPRQSQRGEVRELFRWGGQLLAAGAFGLSTMLKVSIVDNKPAVTYICR
jgi:hypothetical protein